MCGRFTLATDIDFVITRFNISVKFGLDDYKLRYNIAPSQQVLTFINDGNENRVGYLKWGLVPSWSKDPKIGYKMINARAETLAEKPSFKTAFKKRRCLIITESFYEWKREGNNKIPMRIRLKNENVFAMAGLWERWKSPSGEEINSCTIITTNPNELMKPIHDRMPVILNPEDEKVWLDRSIEDTNILNHLLVPYAAEEEDKIYRKELIKYRARLDEESEREKKANIKRKSKELMKNVRLVVLVSSVIFIGYIVFIK